MSLPILQPSLSNIPPQIRGDVTIDPSVIVASGVILNATPGNKIMIHAGVCLGMGTIITAHEGDVEIQANAILGPGTLILGSCVIGSQASLGTSVTVYHAKVERLAVIPAGSIIGDCSRKLDVNESEEEVVVIDEVQQEITIEETETTQTTEIKEEVIVEQENPQDDNIIDKINRLNQNNYSRKKTSFSTTAKTAKSSVKQDSSEQEHKQEEEEKIATSPPAENSNPVESKEAEKSSQSISEEEVEKTETSVESKSSSQTIVKNKEVVGKVYINRLLYTLFPERNREVT
jgi:carbon dioxide concentrating mechanism protein CcmN